MIQFYFCEYHSLQQLGKTTEQLPLLILKGVYRFSREIHCIWTIVYLNIILCGYYTNGGLMHMHFLFISLYKHPLNMATPSYYGYTHLIWLHPFVKNTQTVIHQQLPCVYSVYSVSVLCMASIDSCQCINICSNRQ